MGEKQKVTFNLAAPAQLALEELVDSTGESQTLMLNQALVAYAYLKRKAREGTLTIVQADGRQIEIMFL